MNLKDWREPIPTFYKIDKERRYVVSTGTGLVTKEEVLTVQDQMSNDPEFDPGLSQVADFSGLTDTDVTLADVQMFARRDSFSIHSRRAIIVTGDVAFGFAKVFELCRQLCGASGIRVFRDTDEAFDWIVSENAASASRQTESTAAESSP